MTISPNRRVSALVFADALFVVIQVPLFIAAFKSETIAGILFCCTVALIGTIVWVIPKIRGYLWLRILSGLLVASYVAYFGYGILHVMMYAD